MTLIPALLALRDLDGERHIGMATGPIPWRAILAWAREYCVPCREAFIELVQHGDTVLLEARNAAVERESAQNKRPINAGYSQRRADDSTPSRRPEGGESAGRAMGARNRR